MPFAYNMCIYMGDFRVNGADEWLGRRAIKGGLEQVSEI
jgi:hypothetical protein